MIGVVSADQPGVPAHGLRHSQGDIIGFRAGTDHHHAVQPMPEFRCQPFPVVQDQVMHIAGVRVQGCVGPGR